MFSLLILLWISGLCEADYSCLCSYNVEKPVLDSVGFAPYFRMSVSNEDNAKQVKKSAKTIGYMYEFDCKPVINESGIDKKSWAVIAFEHQKGYIEIDQQLQTQMCPGNPSVSDILTTIASSTTSSPTTSLRSTSLTTTVATSFSSTPAYSTASPSLVLSNRSSVVSTSIQPSVTSSRSTSLAFTLTSLNAAMKTLSTVASSFSNVINTASRTSPLSSIPMTSSSSMSSSSISSSSKPITIPSTPDLIATLGTTNSSTQVNSSTPKSTSIPVNSSGTRRSTTTTRPSTIQTIISNKTNPPTSTFMLANLSSTVKPIPVTNTTTISTTYRKPLTVMFSTKPSNQSTYQPTTHTQSTITFTPTSTVLPSTAKTIATTGLTKESTPDTTTKLIRSTKPTIQPTIQPHSTSQAITSTPSSKMTTSADSTLTTLHTTKPVTSTFPSTQVSLGNNNLCPSSVVQYAQQDNEILAQRGDSCYTVVPHKVSWPHAEGICNSRGGTLFDVRSASENVFFYSLLNTRFNHSVWMGLHDTVVEESFQWTSGVPVNYTNWAPGRKSNFYSHNVEDCALFVNFLKGQWDDIPCGSTSPVFEKFEEMHYFICQFRTINTLPTQSLVQSGNLNLCPSKLSIFANFDNGHLGQYDKSCYEIVPTRVNWNSAEVDCKNKGGYLLHIGSSVEEAYILQFLTGVDSQHAVWIGLNDQGQEDLFSWTSGDPLTYTNWVSNHRNNFVDHTLEDCVVMVPYKQGQWDDIPCDQLIVNSPTYPKQFVERHPYICEFPIATYGSPSVPSVAGPALVGK